MFKIFLELFVLNYLAANSIFPFALSIKFRPAVGNFQSYMQFNHKQKHGDSDSFPDALSDYRGFNRRLRVASWLLKHALIADLGQRLFEIKKIQLISFMIQCALAFGSPNVLGGYQLTACTACGENPSVDAGSDSRASVH